MILGAAWAWALAGIAAFLLLGVLVAVLLGLVGSSREAVRGTGTPDPDVAGGVELPEEGPERTAAETAAEAERLERERDA